MKRSFYASLLRRQESNRDPIPQVSFELRNCSSLIYTPAGEHFGIVPLESMYCNTPVIAVNSGGPTETVLHGQTGSYIV